MLDVLCIGHAAFDVTMSVSRHPTADEKILAGMLACTKPGARRGLPYRENMEAFPES